MDNCEFEHTSNAEQVVYRKHFSSSVCRNDAFWVKRERDGGKKAEGLMVQTIWDHEAEPELMNGANVAWRDKS